MIFVYLALIALVVLLLKHIWDFLAYRSLMNQLPGDPVKNFLLGDLGNYPGNEEEALAYIIRHCQSFKYYHRFWTGPYTCAIMVYHPDMIRKTIKFPTKPREMGLARTNYDMLAPWFGEGLVLSNGPGWYRHRHLLNGSFHQDILKRYIHVYNSCFDVFTQKLLQMSTSSESIDFQPLLNKATLDVILQCAFSLKTDCQSETALNEYTDALCELETLWLKRNLNPLVHVDFVYKLTANGKRFYQMCDVAHGVSEGIIKSRQREQQVSSASPQIRDFLDTLLRARDQDGQGLSLEEIRDEVDTFLAAGHDTSACGIMWTLYCLSQHPYYQEEVFAEVQEVLGDKSDVSNDDLEKLQFTTQCIKESFRLQAPVPAWEKLTTQDIEINGQTVPAGTRIIVFAWGLHNNPHVWEEPTEFRPERFSPENVVKLDHYQFMPFSAGLRNCIGQGFAMNEMKVALSKILLKFKLRADEDNPPRRIMQLTMKSTTGVRIFLQPRDTTEPASI